MFKWFKFGCNFFFFFNITHPLFTLKLHNKIILRNCFIRQKFNHSIKTIRNKNIFMFLTKIMYFFFQLIIFTLIIDSWKNLIAFSFKARFTNCSKVSLPFLLTNWYSFLKLFSKSSRNILKLKKNNFYSWLFGSILSRKDSK